MAIRLVKKPLLKSQTSRYGFIIIYRINYLSVCILG
ncbi:hypothetical protein SAMD00079811_28760 [Scytonema sp. HK-05]|nr:hypothetical protein SAMD00079811_28760 [Scytonema sp. HK-05]